MINIWWPNTIKHCLVIKHANVRVSGQMVKTCLIKHRWNNWYKPLSKHGTHACIKHVWYAAVQMNKTSPIKHANKRNVLRLIECLMAFKFYQTRSNSTKHDVQMVKCLVIKQCLMVFARQHLSFVQALISIKIMYPRSMILLPKNILLLQVQLGMARPVVCDNWYSS